MKLNCAKDIRHGNEQVKAVYLGKQLVWPQDQPEPGLPEGYTRLLAIESTGNYGFTALRTLYLKNESRLVIDYEITREPGAREQYNVFATSVDSWMWRAIAIDSYGTPMSRLCVRTPSGNSVITDGEALKPNVRYLVTAEGNYCEFVPADTSEKTIRLETDYSVDLISNPVLYLNSYVNQINGWMKGARYYSVKHYVDDKLENDFVPVLYRNPETGGTQGIGMYDLVAGEFLNLEESRWSPVYEHGK